MIRSFFAFDPSFTGGVEIAAVDVNGDGVSEVVAAAGAGGGPQIAVFDGVTGNLIESFFAFDPDFRGGATISAARNLSGTQTWWWVRERVVARGFERSI